MKYFVALLVVVALVFGVEKEVLPTLGDLSDFSSIVSLAIAVRQENKRK